MCLLNVVASRIITQVEVPLKEMNTNLVLEIVKFICEEMGWMRSDTTISFICLLVYWVGSRSGVKLQFASFCPAVLTSNIHDQLGCLQDGFWEPFRRVNKFCSDFSMYIWGYILWCDLFRVRPLLPHNAFTVWDGTSSISHDVIGLNVTTK